MCFGIEHVLVRPVRLDLHIRVISKYEIQILERFCQKETLLKVVKAAAVSFGDVAKAGEAASRPAFLINAVESLPGQVLVLLITSNAIGVVNTLHGFRAQHIAGASSPKPSLFIKVGLVSRRRGIRSTDRLVAVYPVEHFRPNATCSLVIGLEMRFCQFDTKLGILILFEKDSGQDKIAAGKAGH